MSANFGYNDSLVEEADTLVNVPKLDYDKDFALAENSANQVILSNLTTPVDQPETIRYAIADVNDVYKNSKIQPIHRQNGVKGKRLLISLRDTARVITPDNLTVDYPISVGMTVEFPVSASLDAADVWKCVCRAVAATQDCMKQEYPNEADERLLNQLMRGGLDVQDGIIAKVA